MSFDEFFSEHYEGVRRSLAVALGDPALAEELAQDAFARALRNWRRVSQMDRPAGWVYVVALRAGRRRRPAEFLVGDEAMSGDHADVVVRDVLLWDAIGRLPRRQRLALVLRFLADLPVADVAAAMDCAVGTVKSTLNAALTRLGVEMREKECDAPR